MAVRNYGNSPLVKINQIGLGDVIATLELNMMSESGVSNSFLSPAERTWNEIKFKTGSISRTMVPVTTVDAYCAEHSIRSVYLMKIDVQGFELKVLLGASCTLPKTDFVFVEAGIVPFYEGAPLFTDVFDYLRSQGFHLIGMRAWHRGNNKLMETDMLFRRDDLLTPIDESVVKVVETLS